MGSYRKMYIIIPLNGNSHEIKRLLSSMASGKDFYIGTVPALDKTAFILMTDLVESEKIAKLVENLEKERKAAVIDLMLIEEKPEVRG